MNIFISILIGLVGGMIGGLIAYYLEKDNVKEQVIKQEIRYVREPARRTEAQEIKDAIEWWYAWNEAREDDMR